MNSQVSGSIREKKSAILQVEKIQDVRTIPSRIYLNRGECSTNKIPGTKNPVEEMKDLIMKGQSGVEISSPWNNKTMQLTIQQLIGLN